MIINKAHISFKQHFYIREAIKNYMDIFSKFYHSLDKLSSDGLEYESNKLLIYNFVTFRQFVLYLLWFY